MSEIEQLRRAQPRNAFLRWSIALLALLAVYSWLSGEIKFGSMTGEQIGRFADEELTPHPLRDRDFDWGVLIDWAGGIVSEQGWPGLMATLWISVLAIFLAGIGGAILCFPAARNFMSPEPFLPSGQPPGRLRILALGAAVKLTRFVQLFLRAVPEFVWCYLFLAMFGPTAWPAVLALAVHNAGILGKLNAEVVENLEPGTLRSLRGLGATRAQIAGTAVFPLAFPRFLLYFFYRFETCVREATILGMLGIVSLGYFIHEARARLYYDEMLLLVLLGAAIVLVADLASFLARRLVRRSA